MKKCKAPAPALAPGETRFWAPAPAPGPRSTDSTKS